MRGGVRGAWGRIKGVLRSGGPCLSLPSLLLLSFTHALSPLQLFTPKHPSSYDLEAYQLRKQRPVGMKGFRPSCQCQGVGRPVEVRSRESARDVANIALQHRTRPTPIQPFGQKRLYPVAARPIDSCGMGDKRDEMV